ncbi:hypothetical protein BGZ80_002361 [Entomortierella chlamydospora]|uniref:Uncharacterized protein n=1 Tax=Entomortierella chlamydospora TaxID=101097 RepID=A0A9P6T320_9FUNG|nr:hypothetical protein BGZ79_000762 [Entomortierella chlamydospora]KAG0021444.1 hypothetical protein BGZ80_002361 [Entomortierella chlamydospora]
MSSLTLAAGPPPPPADDIMVVTEPNYDNYTVGETLYAKAFLRSEEFKELNPKVTITIQKSIRYPKLNQRLGSIRAQLLEGPGFAFKLKEEWLIEEQKNVPFRIRVSWSSPKSGYQDSEDFYFHN